METPESLQWYHIPVIIVIIVGGLWLRMKIDEKLGRFNHRRNKRKKY
ncbi:hypothetical protein [Marinoscillum pacificum]|nr:hypothetical protein [Marinoscillum pacificum]